MGTLEVVGCRVRARPCAHAPLGTHVGNEVVPKEPKLPVKTALALSAETIRREVGKKSLPAPEAGDPGGYGCSVILGRGHRTSNILRERTEDIDARGIHKHELELGSV